MKKQRSPSRREFMAELLGTSSGLALLDSPFGLLLKSILASSVPMRAAQAQTAPGVQTHIQLSQFAAPPRWTYDLFLNPYELNNNPLALNNKMLFTKYKNVNGRYLENSSYETVRLNIQNQSINVPPIWGLSVPDSSGSGSLSIQNLLKQMIVLQGIDILNSSHTGAYDLHYSRPLGGTKSLGALLADTSQRPLAAFNLGRLISFYSQTGKIINTTDSLERRSNIENLIEKLMRSFIAPTGTVKTLLTNATVKAAIEEVNANIYNKSIDDHPLAGDSIIQAQKSSLAMLEQNFGDLQLQWNDLTTKYKTIISNSLKVVIPGVTDAPIGVEGSANRTNSNNPIYNFDGISYFCNSDLRTVFQPDHATNPTRANLMACYFAVLEFISVNKLSSFIHCNMTGFENLYIDKVGDGKAFTAFAQNFDEHSVGAMPSLLINSRYHLAFSACLLAFINTLKSKSLWATTLIEVSGEFNRSARVNGGGSDHGNQGKSVAIYSGSFAEQPPLIIGNVVASTTTDGSRNWGMGAPSKNSRVLNGADMAVTLAYLINRDQSYVTTGATSLVALDSSGRFQLGSGVSKSKRVS